MQSYCCVCQILWVSHVQLKHFVNIVCCSMWRAACTTDNCVQYSTFAFALPLFVLDWICNWISVPNRGQTDIAEHKPYYVHSDHAHMILIRSICIFVFRFCSYFCFGFFFDYSNLILISTTNWWVEIDIKTAIYRISSLC